MKKINFKENKGITVTSTVITVLLMIIILSVITFSTTNGLSVKKLNNMYADIQLLEDKIAMYYLDKGSLPTSGSSITISTGLGNRNPNDNNVYYKIDVSQLSNLTLNNAANEYIINQQSHTIYYQKGIEVEGTTYYTIPTDYTIVNLSEYQS